MFLYIRRMFSVQICTANLPSTSRSPFPVNFSMSFNLVIRVSCVVLYLQPASQEVTVHQLSVFPLSIITRWPAITLLFLPSKFKYIWSIRHGYLCNELPLSAVKAIVCITPVYITDKYSNVWSVAITELSMIALFPSRSSRQWRVNAWCHQNCHLPPIWRESPQSSNQIISLNGDCPPRHPTLVL